VIRPADLVERREEEREKSTGSQSTSSTGDPNTDADTDSQELEETEEISPQLAEATNVLVDLIAFNQLSQATAKNRNMRPRPR
jgi:hypothetical protein